MLSIGDASRLSGIKVPTIRYYEDMGLIEPAGRTAGNQRRYTQSALMRLKFIRHARQLGFDLESIRELMELSDHPESPCADADRIAKDHLMAVEARISALDRLRIELVRMIDQPCGGTVGQCQVIETLADHTNCETEH